MLNSVEIPITWTSHPVIGASEQYNKLLLHQPIVNVDVGGLSALWNTITCTNVEIDYYTHLEVCSLQICKYINDISKKSQTRVEMWKE